MSKYKEEKEKALELLECGPLNEAAWALLHSIEEYQTTNSALFNNLKGCLAMATVKYNLEALAE